MKVKRVEGKKIAVCSVCGIEEEVKRSQGVVRAVQHHPLEQPVVIESSSIALPIAEEECPKCGNKQAYWWMEQTRSSDEPETRFYRCTKCGYTWREYV